MVVFCDRLKLCSTAALTCRTGQIKGRYREKEHSFLLVSLNRAFSLLEQTRDMIIFEQNWVIFGHCAKGYNSLLPPGSLELGRTLVASSARIKAQRSHAHNNERKNLVLVQAKLVSIKNLD